MSLRRSDSSRRARKALVWTFLLLAVALPPRAAAQVDWTRYDARAVELLQQYLRIDTSNPPGNERRAAEFFCELFAREEIGRAHV